MKKFLKNNKYSIILLIIAFISVIWLFPKGIIWQHDIEFHYSRLVGLTNSIKNGDFLAIVHDTFFGYGYANGLFYGNAFLYIPALFSIFGLPYISSFKLMYILISIITIIVTYFVSFKLTSSKKISIFVTILYNFSIYKMHDTFVRGALGEMLAFIFIPLALLGIYEIIFDDENKWYYFTVSFVFLLQSHLISTILLFIFSSIIILCNFRRLVCDKNRIKSLIISVIVGIFLSIFFILPILEQFIDKSVVIFSSGSNYLPSSSSKKIIDLFIRYNYTKPYLGLSIILLLPIRLFICKKDVKEDNNLLKFADMLYVLGIISFISVSNIFPWTLFNRSLSFIQFPWRLYIISTTFLVLSYAIYFKILSVNNKTLLLKIIYIFIIVTSSINSLFYTVQYGHRKIRYNEFFINEIGNGEYLPSGSSKDALINMNKEVISNNDEMILKYKKTGNKVVINYSNNNLANAYIEVPLLYYKGYESTTGKIEKSDNGLIKITNLNENGNILIKYKGTFIQKISLIISIISWIIFIIYLIKIIYFKKLG